MTQIKEYIRGVPWLWKHVCQIKSAPSYTHYKDLREHYISLLRSKNTIYDEKLIVKKVREGLMGRKWKSMQKNIGEIHTCLIFRNTQWQNSLLEELKILGPVTVIDYHEGDIDQIIASEQANWISVREIMHEKTITTVKESHVKNPIDWIFCYFDGRFVLKKTFEYIKNEIGIPTVKMCLDDKNYWDGPFKGGQRLGQVDLAEVFDLSWTTSRTTVGWYIAEGGRGVYLPEGFNPTEHYPTKVDFDIPVSFVGACYGARPLLINFLRKHDIPVQVFGTGWGRMGNGFIKSPNEIFNRSQINLGCGYIGHSMKLTNVKGRDFDIPGAGGGVYLTTFNSDLAQHFHIGKEILCYHSFDECLELIRYYLDRPDECRAIARRARERCLREHRWLHRYIEICQILGILDDGVAPTDMVAQTEKPAKGIA